MATDIPIPFEALWGGTFSQLSSTEIATASASSRVMRDAAAKAAERALEPLFAPERVRKPPHVCWLEALHRAYELPRVLVIGGEDTADMPQLHLSIVTLQGTGARHTALPPVSRPGGCSLPTGRYRLGVSRVGPLIYITGGTGPEGDPCLEVLRFNTLSHRWDDALLRPAPAPMPMPRYGHEAVSVFGRYLLCIGGKAAGTRESPEGSDDVVGGSADVLDTMTGRWKPLPCRLECPRVYFGAAVVGSTVVVCGGMALGGRQAPLGSSEGRLSSCEILDTAELPELFSDGPTPGLCWRRGPSLQFPRYDFSLAGPIDGLLYAVGGSGARRLVEVLDTTNLALRPVADDHREVQRALLSEGWVDLHSRCPDVQIPPSILEADSDADCSKPLRWQLDRVELPQARSCGMAVSVARHLVLAGGSERSVIGYEIGSDSWVPLGAELDIMRLGAKAIAFGCLPR